MLDNACQMWASTLSWLNHGCKCTCLLFNVIVKYKRCIMPHNSCECYQTALSESE